MGIEKYSQKVKISRRITFQNKFEKQLITDQCQILRYFPTQTCTRLMSSASDSKVWLGYVAPLGHGLFAQILRFLGCSLFCDCESLSQLVSAFQHTPAHLPWGCRWRILLLPLAPMGQLRDVQFEGASLTPTPHNKVLQKCPELECYCPQLFIQVRKCKIRIVKFMFLVLTGFKIIFVKRQTHCKV